MTSKRKATEMEGDEDPNPPQKRLRTRVTPTHLSPHPLPSPPSLPPTMLQVSKTSVTLKEDKYSNCYNSDPTMLSDVEFFIPGLTGSSDDTIVYRTLVTEYVLYTNSIFIVNYSNNTLIVNGTTYVITG
jgi:hypothetical protein